MLNALFTGGVWVMYADVARIKVRKASNCSLGDRLCAFAFPMFVGRSYNKQSSLHAASWGAAEPSVPFGSAPPWTRPSCTIS
jgi:hypothetical protein